MKFSPNNHQGHRHSPRNPLVAPARFRQAGAHRARDARQQAEQALRRELERLHRSDP